MAKTRTSSRARKSTISVTDRPVKEKANFAGFQGAFSAAKLGGFRGWFYFPTLDAAGQMPQWTRTEINKKSNWLYNNVDAVRMVIDGLTMDEVDCGLWPKWTTSSLEFNKAVTDAFDNECGDPRFFHAAGRETFYSAQWLIRRSIRLYGEIFAQFLRPESPTAPPLCHFLNAWQCANAMTDLDQSKWKDGIQVDRFGRPQQYRFLTTEKGDAWQDVYAENVLHMHDQFWNGQVHGMGGLAPVARKLFKMDDIENAAINGALMRERIAYAITKKESGDEMPPPLLPGATLPIEIAGPNGTKMMVQKIIAMDDSEADVADLPAGQELKVIESQRATQTPEFIKHLLTGFSYSTLYPNEYVFGLAGLGQGTLVRLVQKRVQRIKNTVRHFQLKDQFCKRWITYWTWQRIASGRFNDVPGGIPADWWKHKLVMPADDTVDVAREGKLYDARLEAGTMSPADYHGMQGRDDEDVEDEVVAATVRKAKKIKKAMDENPDIADLIRFDLATRSGRIAEAPLNPPVNDPNA